MTGGPPPLVAQTPLVDDKKKKHPIRIKFTLSKREGDEIPTTLQTNHRCAASQNQRFKFVEKSKVGARLRGTSVLSLLNRRRLVRGFAEPTF